MKYTLITNASWEPRFALALEGIVNEKDVECVVVLYCREFEERTMSERFHVKSVCSSLDIELIELGYNLFEPIEAWRHISSQLINVILRGAETGSEYMLEMSTMPRFVLWSILSLFRIEAERRTVEVLYHEPLEYGSGWVSRDPMKPFLVPRCGGLTKLGNPTALVIVAGFDTERVSHLISVFEPSLVLVGLQEGDRFKNYSRNHLTNERVLAELPYATTFSLDSYTEDAGLAKLESVIAPLLATYNVLAASIGPKPSALGLMRVRDVHEEVGLVYSPSRDYNSDYSEGLGKCHRFSYDVPLPGTEGEL